MKNISTIAAIILSIIIFNEVHAKSNFVSQIPNGNVFSCITCHVSSGNYSRNNFGKAVEGYISGGKVNWGPALTNLDSDGDGYTNGEELQDPNCMWKMGNQNPGNANLVTNPGNAGSIPTGVIDELTNYGFSITSVSPNPFYNGVSVNYTINVPGIVSAVIYDISGHPVKNLMYERKDAGNYIIQWDGTDNLNNKMLNNIYFLSIQTNNHSLSRKIVLQR